MNHSNNQLLGKLKILYISPRDMLKAKSDPIHIMASCKWFKKNGADVELVAPYNFRPENICQKDIYKIYGINDEDKFAVTHLPTKLTDYSSPSSIRLSKLLAFSFYAIKQIIYRGESKKYWKYIVYSKCYLSFLPFYYLKKLLRLKNVIFIFEVASFRGSKSEIKILNKFSYLIAINSVLKEELIKGAGIDAKRILVPPHGVDDSFSKYMDVTRNEARIELGIPNEQFLIVYSGKIIAENNSEISLILSAAAFLPKVLFVFTGGKQKDIDFYKEITEKRCIKNVIFTGFFDSQSETYIYLRAADALISFYPKNIPTLKYMAPTKIFQYVRSNRVIVSAKYPSIENILGKNGAIYVEPEDINGLVKTINKLVMGGFDCARIAAIADNNIKHHSYKNRSEAILEFILNNHE